MPQADRQHRIQLLSERLEVVDKARRELISQLESLDAQSQTIRLERSQLHNSDASTSNLPNEVLSMIFEAGITQQESSQSHFGEHVSHVSHRWRRIALATSSLWTQISYGPIQINKRSSFEASVNRGAAYLSRSRLAPVDIQIKIYRDQDMSPELFQSLREHIGHCRSLHIYARGRTDVQSVLDATSYQKARLLIDFHISVSTSSPYEHFPTSWLSLGAPLLRTAQFCGVSYSTRPP